MKDSNSIEVKNESSNTSDDERDQPKANNNQVDLPEHLLELISLEQIRDKKSIEITNLNEEIYGNYQQQISDYFSSIAEGLDAINFMHCNLTGSSYIRILSTFPELEILKFHLCEIGADQIDNIPPTFATLTNLREFQVTYFYYSEKIDQQRFVEMTPRILAATKSLEDLRFYLSVPDGDFDHYAEIRAIAALQKNLKMLYVGDNRFFDGSLSDPQFQLDSYYMPMDKSVFSERQLQNFREFFATQTQIGHLVCDVFPDDFRFPQLKSLVKSFNAGKMESFHEEYDGMEPNPYITSLYIEFHLDDNEPGRAEIINTIVQKFPNLENLEINYNIGGGHTDWNMLVPLNSLKNIRKLSFLSLSNRQISRLNLPTLESIEISDDGEEMESLNRFIIRHPQLKELHLVFEQWDYTSLMPGLYMFIEFTLKLIPELESMSILFYNFGDDEINAEEIGRIIKDNSTHEDFKLTFRFDFDDSDRPDEVFMKS